MCGGYVESTLPMTSDRREARANDHHSIEMNVINIAACIPILRPLVLVLLGRPSGPQYRTGAGSRKSFSQRLRPSGSNLLRNLSSDQGGGLNRNKAFDSTSELRSMAADKDKTIPLSSTGKSGSRAEITRAMLTKTSRG